MTAANWTPRFGTRLDPHGVAMRVCAPGARDVRVLLEDRAPVPLVEVEPGTFEGRLDGAKAGDRYRLLRDADGPWPDPCSRWQPDGVHGPSMVIDPDAFAWADYAWRGVPRHRLVIYELHVGTFTPEGTFAAAMERLPYLVDLGVTAVELMPVAAFPGRRNWGYDGAALFAPSEQYGHPDDLRAFVDRAHALGIAVLLDVVYNHLGPDGAYLAAFMPTVFSDRHASVWGRGINLDDVGSEAVRRIFVDNALLWLIEYHLDGLRLDATHAILDDSPEHLLAQVSREAEQWISGREIHLIAEDSRNLPSLLQPRADGGYGLTGVWADDFHHALRRHVAGDHEAWYRDFAGTTPEIARALRTGWIYSGESSVHYGGPRGASPDSVSIDTAVVFIQNHDQVGNRAQGERLHHQVRMSVWLAAVTLLLTAPETPLLFMGQEWAASTPFLFFTDHEPGLGAQVVEGRRHEFARFSAFADPANRAAIPNPQDESTWHRSVLRWEEASAADHAHALSETRALLALRAAHLDMPRDRAAVRSEALDTHALWLDQPSALGGRLLTVVAFEATAHLEVPLPAGARVSLLHATRPDGERPVVSAVRAANGRLVIDGAADAFGIVLHVTEAGA